MSFEHKINTLKIKNKVFYFDQPKIMGIINLTPDSFYQGSRSNTLDKLMAMTERMLNEGADFIDLGAYSSRPGAGDISVDTELSRLLPAVNAISGKFPEIIISVDTFRASVAKEALLAGADMINDISAGNADPDMKTVIAEYKIPCILMHMQGNPENMQSNPQYANVVKEVLLFLEKRCLEFKEYGVKDIIIDPGMGFGKTLFHNYEILKALSVFRNTGRPVLVGLSRKSMIYKALGSSPDKALNGTTVLNTLALLNGADILRVHDVKEAKETIKLVSLYQNFRNRN